MQLLGGVALPLRHLCNDTQRITADYVQFAYAAGMDGANKRSVYDALSLYLNFINLFMMLMQLLGNRNNN